MGLEETMEMFNQDIRRKQGSIWATNLPSAGDQDPLLLLVDQEIGRV